MLFKRTTSLEVQLGLVSRPATAIEAQGNSFETRVGSDEDRKYTTATVPKQTMYQRSLNIQPCDINTFVLPDGTISSIPRSRVFDTFLLSVVYSKDQNALYIEYSSPQSEEKEK